MMDKFKVITDKILLQETLVRQINNWRLKNQKIVFTNGCFDLIHYGHVNYLARAASLGNRLIVGINSDDSVRRLNKGERRPIQDELSRATIMAGFGFVDAVIIFNEDTPLELITMLQPDVLAKGGDWKPDQIVGSELVLANGGQVHSLDFVEGFSTTSIESRIKGK